MTSTCTPSTSTSRPACPRSTSRSISSRRQRAKASRPALPPLRELAVVSWNQLLLYPQGSQPDDIQYQATLKVPKGWRYGTALPIQKESGDEIEFQPASATTLIDSPVSAGAHYKTFDLGSELGARALPARGRRQRSRPGSAARSDRQLPPPGEGSRRLVRRAPLPRLPFPLHAQRSRGSLRPGAPRVQRRPHRRAFPDRARHPQNPRLPSAPRVRAFLERQVPPSRRTHHRRRPRRRLRYRHEGRPALGLRRTHQLPGRGAGASLRPVEP